MVRLVLRTEVGMFDTKCDRERARPRVIGGIVLKTWETNMGLAGEGLGAWSGNRVL